LSLDSPRDAKWLSEHECAITLSRIKNDNSGVVNRTFKKGRVFEALRDFNMWSNAFIIGSAGIPNVVFSSFGTLVISGFGYTAFDSLLLLMPIGFCATFSVFFSGYVGQRSKDMWYYVLTLDCTIALIGSLMAWLGPRGQPSVLSVYDPLVQISRLHHLVTLVLYS